MTFTLTNGIFCFLSDLLPRLGRIHSLRAAIPPRGDTFLGAIAVATEFSERRVAQGFPALLFADDGGRQGA
jgi:hypothetical protein